MISYIACFTVIMKYVKYVIFDFFEMFSSLAALLQYRLHEHSRVRQDPLHYWSHSEA